MPSVQQVACRFGEVTLNLTGTPIACVDCCCNSCRAAGLRLQRLPGAQRLLGPHGTTRFVMYRKDRVAFLAGVERLAAFRLSADAGTRRVLATCCNTPLFLELTGGHWLSLYGGLWPEDARPPLQMRTMVGDLPDPSVLPADVPNLKQHSLRFYARLMKAWIAMGLRSPDIRIEGQVHA